MVTGQDCLGIGPENQRANVWLATAARPSQMPEDLSAADRQLQWERAERAWWQRGADQSKVKRVKVRWKDKRKSSREAGCDADNKEPHGRPPEQKTREEDVQEHEEFSELLHDVRTDYWK